MPLLPVVVGAHPEAERHDRPRARRLADALRRRLDDDALEPLVLTDLWYLNDRELRLRPTLAVGRPEVNAAVAALARDIPTRLVVDGRYRIQLDPEGIDPHACIWGATGEDEDAAVSIFIEKYLDAWTRSARMHDLVP